MPPPPRNDSKIVAIVLVVVIIVVVVPTILGFVLYLMVSDVIVTPSNTRPVVTFASISKAGAPPSNNTVSFSVAGASEPISAFSSFKVQITKDGAPLSATAQTLYANQIITFGSSTVRLIVRDLAGEGKLTGGDMFSIYGMGESHNWKFSLIWAADGSEIQSASWQTP